MANAIWSRILKHQGQTFYTKEGVSFDYVVKGKSLYISNSPRYPISQGNLFRALEQMPAAGPSKLRRVRGRAYLWGLLRDERIVADTGKWYNTKLIDTSILPELKKFAAFRTRKTINGDVLLVSKHSGIRLTLTPEKARKHFSRPVPVAA